MELENSLFNIVQGECIFNGIYVIQREKTKDAHKQETEVKYQE